MSTTNYHLPFEKGDALDHDILNGPLGTIDAQITANSASIAALEAEVADARLGKESLTAATNAPIGQTPPSSSSDTGTAGELRGDTNKLYICVAPDTWKQITLENWS